MLDSVHKERLTKEEEVKKFVVCMGEEKTKEERRLGEECGVRTSPYKCCKTSFVNSPLSTIIL
jgi:hypothetical protein